MSHNLKVGTEVKIIAGDYKGQKGKITKLHGKNQKTHVSVDGVPGLKKCQKADPRRNIEGGFITVDRKIHISNVSIDQEKTSE